MEEREMFVQGCTELIKRKKKGGDECVSEGERQRVRKGSHASSSSVPMIFVTPGLWKSASPRLYVGLNWDLGKKNKKKNVVALKCSELSLPPKRAHLWKTLSGRFIFNRWLVNVNPPLPQNHKTTATESFSIFRQEHKGWPCKRGEAPWNMAIQSCERSGSSSIDSSSDRGDPRFASDENQLNESTKQRARIC